MFQKMTFYDLGARPDVAASQIFQHTDEAYRRNAEQAFAGRTVGELMGSAPGMVAEYYGSTVYVTSATNDVSLDEMASLMIHEALHMLGYGHPGNEFPGSSKDDIFAVCLKNLGIAP
jgi:hypothetical protein